VGHRPRDTQHRSLASECHYTRVQPSALRHQGPTSRPADEKNARRADEGDKQRGGRAGPPQRHDVPRLGSRSCSTSTRWRRGRRRRKAPPTRATTCRPALVVVHAVGARRRHETMLRLVEGSPGCCTVTRRTEPRIAAKIWSARDARTVLDVGAGTGSDEPAGRDVFAVEPSALRGLALDRRPPGQPRAGRFRCGHTRPGSRPGRHDCGDQARRRADFEHRRPGTLPGW